MKFFLFLIIFIPRGVMAYTNFIGYGYKACINCHYNPFGNGPLTDYGRAIGASMLADRVLYRDDVTESEIAEQSNFMYTKKPKHDWFRPSVNYRGLYLTSGYKSKSEDSKYIAMFLSGNVVLKGGHDDKYIMVAEAGYAPKPSGSDDDNIPLYRSREHYFGYRPSKEYGLYIGLMDKVFGIRLPDHNFYSRSVTENTMNDQTHGVLVHINKNRWESGLQFFQGNLGQDEDLRQVGVTGKLEVSIGEQTRTGVSHMSSKSSFTQISASALELRVGFGKGSALLAEVGQVNKKIEKDQTEVTTQYLMMQNYVRLRRGLHQLISLEYLKSNTEEDGELYRIGPGIQWFPIQGIELRFDVYNKKSYSKLITSKDIWDITGQLHLWF